MNTVWAGDFSYNYLMLILKTVKNRFQIKLLGDGVSGTSEPQIFLRHDIDVSISRALAMAEIEAEQGIRSTYMFIPNSRLYDIRDNALFLKKFIQLGHEVALHFDLEEHLRQKQTKVEDLMEEIEQDCQVLSEVTGEPVRSVSFHRPMPHFLRSQLTINGRINAVATELMETYISDSKGMWRNGEPVPFLQSVNKPVVQVLIHPVWWGVKHINARERLEEFYRETIDSESAEPAALDKYLTLTLPGVRRLKFRFNEASEDQLVKDEINGDKFSNEKLIRDEFTNNDLSTDEVTGSDEAAKEGPWDK